MDRLIQDVRYGLRCFLRQPVFTLTAVLALGLGIGANTAVFSVVYGVLVRPLPYPDSDRLIFVEDTHAAVASASVSFPKLVALRESNRTLTALGGHTPAALILTGSGEPEQVQGSSVTAEVFRAVNVQPMRGRWFTAGEDEPNGPKAIILSEALWRRRFGADPKIIERTIQVNGVSHTVVGVMPRNSFPAAQAWIPLAMSAGTAGNGNFLRLVGRMRPGVTLEQARADLRSVSADFNRKAGLQRDVTVLALHEAVVGSNRRVLLILQGAVAFVLLVACANVANLLLARSVVRQRELAIRAAVGAGRGRIVRQMLTESLMLSAASAVVGVLLGSWLLRLFIAIAPPGFPRLQSISLDTGVLAYTVVTAALTGLVFGLAPARRGFRTNPNDTLRDAGIRGATAAGSRGASRALVVVEVALALVLVIGAGLMVKSLLRLQAQDTGYDVDQVFTFNLNLPPARYPDRAPRRFYEELLAQIRTVPGVEAAAAINFAPMINYGFNGPFSVEGRPPFEPGRAPAAEYRYITPGYFETMGLRPVRGREFTAQDDEKGPPAIIINQTMADKYFGGTDPVGARMWVATDPRPVLREVVGVVPDVRDARLDRAPVPETFMPHAQTPLGAMGVVVRTTAGMGIDRVLPAIRARVASLDPDLPIVRPQTLQAAVEATTSTTRMTSVLTSVFALVAALLASVGVYSLIAYSVAQRTREIGIRVALGANRRSVLTLVVGEGVMLAAMGVLLGVPAAMVMTRLLETMLYEVRPSDPTVIAATSAGVFAVAIVASIVPAWRAIRIDPMLALRAE